MILPLVLAELKLTLRTREIWLYLLAPAGLFLPVVVFAVSFALSLTPATQILVDMPEEQLEHVRPWMLDELGLHPVQGDPEEAAALGYAGGIRVEGLQWHGYGPPKFEAKFQAAARHFHRETVRQALGGEAAMADLPVPHFDKRAQPQTVEVEVDGLDRSMLRFVFVVLALIVALYTLPAQVIHDRAHGVLESLLATRSAILPVFAAKVVAYTLFQVVGIGLFVLSLWGFLPGGSLLEPSPLDLVAVGVALIATNAALVGVAAQSKTVMSAWNGGALILLAMLLPMVVDVPWFVPLLGLFDAPTPATVLGAVVVTLATAWAVLRTSASYTLRRELFFGEVNG